MGPRWPTGKVEDTQSYILTQAPSASAFELQEPSSAFYSSSARASLLARLDKLTSDVHEELTRQGIEGDQVVTERMLNMRFEGTDTALMVLPNANDGMERRTLRQHSRESTSRNSDSC
ncbi:hypothetical protein J3R83DRAFT_9653 [Lanmaoa asiatica]|nr:hypothetical protein J3R83DRAFT_9653 [Lanmaoa asiatica]